MVIATNRTVEQVHDLCQRPVASFQLFSFYYNQFRYSVEIPERRGS